MHTYTTYTHSFYIQSNTSISQIRGKTKGIEAIFSTVAVIYDKK